MKSDVRRAIGWLALVMAVCATALLALRLTAVLDIYCDWSRPCGDAMLATVPTYVAMFGLTLTLLLISGRMRWFAVPRLLILVSLTLAVLASTAFVVMTVAAYDQILATYGNTAVLGSPQVPAAWPPAILAMSSLLWRALVGTSIAVISLSFDLVGVPRVLTILGQVAALALGASATIVSGDGQSIYGAYAATALWSGCTGLALLLSGRGMTLTRSEVRPSAQR